MSTKVAINGFGRIGRLFLRAAAKQGADIEVVAVNDLTDARDPRPPAQVRQRPRGLAGRGLAHRRLPRLRRQDHQGRCRWPTSSCFPGANLGVDVVVECTGRYTERANAGLHLDQGAKKVIISAPAKDPDITVVMGVNDADYDPARHHIISNASCTTNCLAPVAKVLLDSFGIEQGFMTTSTPTPTTSGSSTCPTRTCGGPGRPRSHIIPTSTGAARPSVWSSRSSRASWTAMPCGCRCPTARWSI